jgi:hypothetical protein
MMSQFCVIGGCGQAPLVVVPVGVTARLVVVPGMRFEQQVETTGGSNAQVVPHCTVLLVGQTTWRQLLAQQPMTVTVWLQLV